LACGHLRAVITAVTSFITFFETLAADVDNLRTNLQRLKRVTVSEDPDIRLEEMDELRQVSLSNLNLFSVSRPIISEPAAQLLTP
jgi:hypothetical protein